MPSAHDVRHVSRIVCKAILQACHCRNRYLSTLLAGRAQHVHAHQVVGDGVEEQFAPDHRKRHA
ncbi:MAG: hypothetical protein HC814_07195 [Rhodobacteraceae bacterium]|nr:hypothetical protein [Paracoccaceae bacterium]